MDYKKLFRIVVRFLAHPAKAWMRTSHKGSKNAMLGEFFYPFIMLCGAALFLGRIFTNGLGWDSIYTGMISAALRSLSLLFAYYLSVYAVSFFTDKYTSSEYPRDQLALFTGYSMVVVLGLDVCLGLFPEVRVLAFIAQFYTLKIVWDGAAVLMKIPEDRRLAYTMVVALIVMAMPAAVGKLMSFLSIVLR